MLRGQLVVAVTPGKEDTAPTPKFTTQRDKEGQMSRSTVAKAILHIHHCTKTSRREEAEELVAASMSPRVPGLYRAQPQATDTFNRRISQHSSGPRVTRHHAGGVWDVYSRLKTA